MTWQTFHWTSWTCLCQTNKALFGVVVDMFSYQSVKKHVFLHSQFAGWRYGKTAAISDLVYTCTLTPYNHKQTIRLILTSNNRITEESELWNCHVRYNQISDCLLPENPLTVSNQLNISFHVVTRTVLKVVNSVQFLSPCYMNNTFSLQRQTEM